MYDAKLMLIDSAAAVEDNVTGDAVDFRGEDHKVLHYRIIIPEVADDTTATIKIQESADGTTWVDLITPPAYSAAADTVVHARSRLRYRRATITKAGTGVANFDCGKVKMGVVPAGTHRDW